MSKEHAELILDNGWKGYTSAQIKSGCATYSGTWKRADHISALMSSADGVLICVRAWA